MTSIGRFGTKHAEVDLTFDYFDETIRVNPDASQLTIVEFLDQASQISQNDEVLGARTVMKLLHEIVHPDDFEGFWATAKRERQQTPELMELAKAVMEAIAGFPTGQQSASPTGPSNTRPKSVVDLPSQDPPTPNLSPASSSAADKALAMLRGRPDLQEFVVMNEEAERAKAMTG